MHKTCSPFCMCECNNSEFQIQLTFQCTIFGVRSTNGHVYTPTRKAFQNPALIFRNGCLFNPRWPEVHKLYIIHYFRTDTNITSLPIIFSANWAGIGIFSGHGTFLYTAHKSADHTGWCVLLTTDMWLTNQRSNICLVSYGIKNIELDCTRHCSQRYCITN
jgi:hypothetical protein